MLNRFSKTSLATVPNHSVVHTYKNESRSLRACIGREVGFFLDYWLLLHADSTHSLWRTRPISLSELARATIECNGRHDTTLQRALIQEWKSALNLDRYISGLGGLSAHAVFTSSPELNWARWQSDVTKLEIGNLRTSFVSAISHNIQSGSLETVAFLARRFAAELSLTTTENKLLYRRALGKLLRGEDLPSGVLDFENFADRLHSATKPENEDDFDVCINLAPTTITTRVAKVFRHKRTLLTDPADENEVLLRGVLHTVHARTPNQAAEIALELTQTLLETMRLSFYVRTHIIGAAKVKRVTSAEEIHLALPQPFWARDTNNRAIPRLPKLFHKLLEAVEQKEVRRWLAARSHLSQAIADWPEDTHSAAAHVWQALESFAQPGAGALPRVRAMAPAFIASAQLEMANWLATRLHTQAQACDSRESDQFWHTYQSDKYSIEQWLGDCFTRRGIPRTIGWHPLLSAEVLFGSRVGILNQIAMNIQYGFPTPWLTRRINDDLALMYALRNKFVHSGQKLFSRSVAAYLGRLGIEMLLSAMNSAASAMQQQTPSGFAYVQKSGRLSAPALLATRASPTTKAS